MVSECLIADYLFVITPTIAFLKNYFAYPSIKWFSLFPSVLPAVPLFTIILLKPQRPIHGFQLNTADDSSLPSAQFDLESKRFACLKHGKA